MLKVMHASRAVFAACMRQVEGLPVRDRHAQQEHTGRQEWAVWTTAYRLHDVPAELIPREPIK